MRRPIPYELVAAGKGLLTSADKPFDAPRDITAALVDYPSPWRTEVGDHGYTAVKCAKGRTVFIAHHDAAKRAVDAVNHVELGARA